MVSPVLIREMDTDNRMDFHPHRQVGLDPTVHPPRIVSLRAVGASTCGTEPRGVDPHASLVLDGDERKGRAVDQLKEKERGHGVIQDTGWGGEAGNGLRIPMSSRHQGHEEGSRPATGLHGVDFPDGVEELGAQG